MGNPVFQHCSPRLSSPMQVVTFSLKGRTGKSRDEGLVPHDVIVQNVQSSAFCPQKQRRIIDHRDPNFGIWEMLLCSSDRTLQLLDCSLFGPLPFAVKAKRQDYLFHNHFTRGFCHQGLGMPEVSPRVTVHLQVRDTVSRNPSQIGVPYDEPLLPYTKAPIYHLPFGSDMFCHSKDLRFRRGIEQVSRRVLRRNCSYRTHLAHLLFHPFGIAPWNECVH